MADKVNDLRSALALLKSMPGQLIETDVEVETMALHLEVRLSILKEKVPAAEEAPVPGKK